MTSAEIKRILAIRLFSGYAAFILWGVGLGLVIFGGSDIVTIVRGIGLILAAHVLSVGST